MLSERKKSEIIHGSQIQHRAESIWGWATDAGRLRADRRIELISRIGRLQNAKMILEIGCGTGEFTQRLLKNCTSNLVAVDISLDLLKRAKAKIGNSGVNFIIADAENLPFKDNIMEAVVGVSILHHLNINIVIKEIMRILKNSGKMVFTEPNMLNPQVFLMKNIRFIKRILGEVEGERAFLRWAIKRRLTLAGFRRIIVRPFDFLHPYTPKWLINFIQFAGKIIENTPLLKEISGSLIIFAEKIKEDY